MKKVGLVTATIVVAVIFFLLATLPPLPVRLIGGIDPDWQRRTVAGAYHIHSTRSDGAPTRMRLRPPRRAPDSPSSS